MVAISCGLVTIEKNNGEFYIGPPRSLPQGTNNENTERQDQDPIPVKPADDDTSQSFGCDPSISTAAIDAFKSLLQDNPALKNISFDEINCKKQNYGVEFIFTLGENDRERTLF